MIEANKIITISLKENHERRVSTEKELLKLNVKTDFFLAERDRGHEERGCFNSHREVCKQALQDESCQSLLVFEDDVKVLSHEQKQIDKINWFIKQKMFDFDVLYLGLIIGKMWPCGLKGIVRAKGAGAHGYILSRRGMKKLAAYAYNGTPIDKILKYDFKCYSVYPIILEQHPEEILSSDITVFRGRSDVKDEHFWLENYRKQKGILWKNFYKIMSF